MRGFAPHRATDAGPSRGLLFLCKEMFKTLFKQELFGICPVVFLPVGGFLWWRVRLESSH